MDEISVSVVEDDELVRDGFRKMIVNYPGLQLSGTFENGEAFVKAFDKLETDVVLMDISMPVMNGIECVKRLKPLRPHVHYLMCTVLENPETIFEALCAGASGYMLKSTPSEKLFDAIRDIYNGGSPMSSQIARLVVNTFHSHEAKSSYRNILTQREQEVLDLLSGGYRYKEIASKLGIGEETVRSHCRKIYEKLQVSSRTEALNKVYPK